jgi:GT2 family glycosyltransferase
VTVVVTSPKASIIIVSYNTRSDLGPCLSSLLRTTGPDYEIILVDNASSDGSADYVEATFPGVRVVRNPNNTGFGHANNLGASLAAGQFLAFLNPDTVVEPGWLAGLVDALEADPATGLVTSQLRLLGHPTQLNTCGNEVHCTGLALCRGMGVRADDAAFAEPREVTAISGAAFAMRKTLFDTLDGFDDSFFLYVEDTDLSWRARLAGYKCLYVPSSVVYHDYSLRFGPHKTYYQERNRYLMLLKSLRWPTLLALLPALLLGEVVTWGFVLLREPRRAANKLRVFGWLWQHRGEIGANRRRTQALRRVTDHALLAPAAYRLAYEQTGDGLVARAAHLVLDPLFFVASRLALTVIRW